MALLTSASSSSLSLWLQLSADLCWRRLQPEQDAATLLAIVLQRLACSNQVTLVVYGSSLSTAGWRDYFLGVSLRRPGLSAMGWRDYFLDVPLGREHSPSNLQRVDSSVSAVCLSHTHTHYTVSCDLVLPQGDGLPVTPPGSGHPCPHATPQLPAPGAEPAGGQTGGVATVS